MTIVEQIRQFVEAECKKKTSKYGHEPYLYHFLPTQAYAKQLAEEQGADVEVVEIAALLHDIGSIRYSRKDHDVTGAKIAKDKLRKLDYPNEKISKVVACILNHRSSRASNRVTLEEQIIADADGISNFNNVSGIFKAAFTYEKKDQKTAQADVRNKLIKTYDKLSPRAKEIVKPKYEAAIVLFS